MEFNPFHTINGHGLCKILADAKYVSKQEILEWEQEKEMYNVEQVAQSSSIAPWCLDIRQFLENNTLATQLLNKQKREIRLKSLSYQLVHGVLFIKHHNGVFLRCLYP